MESFPAFWGFLSWMVFPSHWREVAVALDHPSSQVRRRSTQTSWGGDLWGCWKVCRSFQASHLPSWNQAWQWTLPQKWRFLVGTLIELNMEVSSWENLGTKWVIFQQTIFDDQRVLILLWASGSKFGCIWFSRSMILVKSLVNTRNEQQL